MIELSYDRKRDLDFPTFTVAVEDFKFEILHPMQQHVHARQVISVDVAFYP